MNGGRADAPAAPGAPSYLGRLLDVLAIVGMHPGLSLGEVSRRTGVPVSTASRLAGLLIERGFVRRDPENNRLDLGPSLERLALRSFQRLQDFGGYQASIDRLTAQTGESASLGVINFDRIVLVARGEPDQSLRVVVKVGDLVPPLQSAMGRVILSFLPEHRRTAVLRESKASARQWPSGADLEEIRTAGYFCEVDNFAVGLRCIAVPFFGAAGEPVGGISVAGPSVRFTSDRADAALRLLRVEARMAAEDIGCLRSTP